MISLSVPGKTFLCGEYIALVGGPTVLLATGPRFVMNIAKKTEQAGLTPTAFHPESPAGRLIQKYPEAFAPYEFQFSSPYGHGGFGGSTAEYLFLSALKQMGAGLETEHQLDLDVRETLTEYRDLHKNESTVPSGADLVAQACGFITAFERRTGRIQVYSWLFKGLGFCLFATGTKLPTHEHLKNLKLDALEPLFAPAEKIQSAFSQHADAQLLLGVNELTQELEHLGLQAAETQRFRRELWSVPGVRAVKGCGAMGADVVLVIYDRREAEKREILSRAEKLGLKFVADEEALTPGIQKDMAHRFERGLSV